MVEVHGPFGRFGMEREAAESGRFVFIASGTGIAPFRSMVRSYPEMDYKLIHGVRYSEEAYDRDEYAPERYVLCSSRDSKGSYQGRLTGYLKMCKLEPETHFYLCGNSDMIFDSLEILKGKGFGREQIHCEVYF
jgi:ferredoxin--NADP+ reductase/benzoate/toluate 1,2-dioxygenase reductase subunit